MSRDLKLYLDDILNSINKIERFTEGITSQSALVEDEKTFDAVAMNLQVIGESTKQIPDEIRRDYPDIEWKDIIGLRSFIAHVYFALDEEIIWNTVQHELTSLKACIISIKQALQEGR